MIDINGIMDILPHRYPFLLVDRILEVEGDRRIVGIKNVTANEPFFQGHFPGRPIMPGVLIAEMAAQVGGIMILLARKEEHLVPLLVGIEGMRFRRQVVPGDTLRAELTKVSARGNFGKIHGRLTVDGELVMEGSMMYALVDPQDGAS